MTYREAPASDGVRSIGAGESRAGVRALRWSRGGTIASGLLRGFTLVELMVVVVIIGIMATVVTVSVTDYLVTAKQNVARSEIATIKNALALFFMETDRYPTNDEGLGALKKGTPQHPNGILASDTRDPWNREYVYLHPGAHGPYEVMSLGADGQEGGTGQNADILSWELEGSRP
ncbi:MAG: type II secretion system major pseudopilin GspG [Planctomycetes bacterium]|nr:type II secretion system major pseudopilin GspG [Planctomycetota bacterium]